MGNFLLTAERTTIEWVIDYLTKGGSDKPLDEKAADELSKHYSTFGYDSEIKLREDLRDAPVITLLTIALHWDDRT